MKVRFWGTRGSIPSPLRAAQIEDKICQAIYRLPDIDIHDLEAVRAYVRELPPLLRSTAGGNTPCIEVQGGGDVLILDAGSGLRELGLELMHGPCGRGQGTVHLVITHPHWDHIQGFPFFVPAFIPGNRIFIYGIHDLKTALESQQSPPYFPVSLAYMQAHKEFVSLQAGQPISVGKVTVNTILNAHPGDSCSVRIEDQRSTLVYATDAEYKELDDASVQPYISFFRNADALVFDSQYTLKEAWKKVDWGHSSALIGADLARAAGVKKLILFHHDPTYSDAQLEEIQASVMAYQAQNTAYPACQVIVGYEGLTLDLAPPGDVALQILRDREAAVLVPTTVFDERGVSQVAQQLAHLAEQDISASSIIDLSQVETLTTASLKALIALQQEGKGAPLILAAPSDRVRQVIKLSGYLNYFAIYPSVEAALAGVQAREALNLPGQVIRDRYQIGNKVGESRSGTVLQATDTQINRTVALKILSPSFGEEALDRLERQTRRIMDLDHRNIAQVFAWDQDRGFTFIVEEFIADRTLQSLLDDGDITFSQPARVRDIAVEIARALEYAHSRGVIHGDLKPQNVFLTDGGVKLGGFGLGRLEEGRNLLDAPLLFLTAPYLAPEQILGQPLDARTDLYALGIILYRLFTGRLPFEGTDQQIMQAHLRQPPRPPRELNPELSLSQEHLILKLLAKNPNDRYASAQQARRISSSLMASREETLRSGQRFLVGREKQLQSLQSCWEEARAGRGQLVFISGEPGIGKTSLAQQAAAQSGPPVLLIESCQETESSPAYQLFGQVLRSYLATVPPELLDEAAHHLLGNLTRLVPEIRQALPNLPVPPPLEPKQEQLRLMTSLTLFIQQAARRRPWLLILDDLQWADPSSLELLRYLGRHLPSMALLVIGIYRDVELERGHPLLSALRDLSHHPTFRHLPLDRLDQAGVGQVLLNLWQQPVPETLIHKIYQHTEGNPFYVEEVAQGLVDDGLVTLHEGQWQFPELAQVRLPQTVREAIWHRIHRLSPDTQTLLREASVLGQTFEFDVLQEMSGLSKWETLEHLDMALERQLVQEAPGDTHLRFSHFEVQYVLYADMGTLRRRLLHRQAGEVMERRAGTEAERIAEDLAHHFREAGELEKAAGYSFQAARRAQAAYANESALLWHNRTLEMLNQLGPDQASQFQSLRVAALASLGEVQAMLGQYDESLAHYASARALLEAETRSVDQVRQLASLCRQTAEVYERQSEYSLAFEWLEKGLSYLDQDKPTIEKSQLYLVAATAHHHQGRDDQAMDWCQHSLDIASQVKTRQGQQVIGQVLYLLGSICTRRGDLRYAAQLCQESVSVYQQIDDRVGQAMAYNNLGNAYYEQGDWDQASEAYRKSLTIRQEIGDIYGQGTSANNLASIYLNRGEWNQAASLYEQSRAIWEQIGVPLGEAATLSNLAQVHLYQGNWPEAHTCLSRSQALFAQIGSTEYLPELERRWGELGLKTGKLDEALEHTRRSIDLAIEQSNPLEESMSRRMLGEVHLARGEREPAQAALRQSLQALADLNEYEAAKSKLSLARLMIEAGPTTDTARDYMAQAIQTFEKLGAQADLAEAQMLNLKLSRL